MPILRTNPSVKYIRFQQDFFLSSKRLAGYAIIMDTQPPMSPEIPPSSPELKQWTVALHLSPLIGLFLPFCNIVAPLVIWLIKKQDIPALDPVGKIVLNFQISWAIWVIVSVAVAVVGSCLVVPIVAPFIMGISWLVLTIIGGVKASNGESYAYPLTLALLK